MPLTRLDPHTALISIDMQQGIVALPCTHPMAPVVGHVATLARAFRDRALPVVLVNVAGGAPGRTEQGPRGGERPAGWAELIPEVDARPGDHRVTKHSWGAFTNTGLHERLQRLGVTQVAIAGVATSIGVETTARQAFELGYNVTLPIDAMTDLDAAAHDNSVRRIFPRLAETGSTAELLALLGHRDG